MPSRGTAPATTRRGCCSRPAPSSSGSPGQNGASPYISPIFSSSVSCASKARACASIWPASSVSAVSSPPKARLAALGDLSIRALLAPHQRGDDRVRVVDAAAPDAAARLLQRGPEPRVVRQVRIGREVGPRRAARPARVPLFGAASTVSASPTRSTLPSSALRSITIWIEVAVAHLADRTAGQRLGADVADAGARARRRRSARR